MCISSQPTTRPGMKKVCQLSLVFCFFVKLIWTVGILVGDALYNADVYSVNIFLLTWDVTRSKHKPTLKN